MRPIRQVVFCVVIAGCGGGKSGAPARPGDTGGMGGADDTGGSAGSAGVAGTAGKGGASGGGIGGGGGGVVDASPATDTATADAPVTSSEPDGGAAADATSPTDGKYWRSPCPAGWTREQCCMHYCGCMATNCAAQTPANCQATCVAAKNWRLDCRVEQCFESLDPCCPKDAVTHCKHAIEMPLKCQGLQP